MTSIDRFTQSFYSQNNKSAAALITSHSNRFYLSHFSSSDGILFVTSEKNYLIVDFRYYEMAKNNTLPSIDVLLAESRFSNTIEALIKKHSVKTLWIEDGEMSVAELEAYKKRFSTLEFNFLGSTLLELRAVKSEEEIEFIKSAQRITDNAFSHILNFISKGKTEMQIALELEYFMRSNGAEKVAFDTICVSGKNSSLPHGTPTDKEITPDSFITMDFGAKYKGYCADMTRTVVLGHASEEMIRVYNIVLEAQKRALDTACAGVVGSKVDSAARDYIYSSGFEGCFGHSTGHGLGIDVHESPSFSPAYHKKLPQGAVLSVEPGIYIEGKFGVRIEDIVVLRDNGCDNLTHSPKSLLELPL